MTALGSQKDTSDYERTKVVNISARGAVAALLLPQSPEERDHCVVDPLRASLMFVARNVVRGS